MAEIRVEFSDKEVTNNHTAKRTGKIGSQDVVLISWPVAANARETRISFATVQSVSMMTLTFAGQRKSGVLSNGISVKKPAEGMATATLTTDFDAPDCIIHVGVQLRKGTGD